MAKSKVIHVKGIGIATLQHNGEDYISLTDIAREKNANEPKDVVKNWMPLYTKPVAMRSPFPLLSG
jgi:hypothetical protein